VAGYVRTPLLLKYLEKNLQDKKNIIVIKETIIAICKFNNLESIRILNDALGEIDNSLLIRKINEEKLVDKQPVVIETQEFGVLEIGLGMGEESMMFFIPESEEEDIRVSCNELVDRAKTEQIKISHALEEEEVECTSCNIVSFSNVMYTLEAFLEGKEFINFVDWYTY
jgi:hypothetical protein